MAKGRRSFSPQGIPEKQDDYHGGCKVYRLSPDVPPQEIPSVNIVLTFEEALRLSVAVQSAVLKLNRYNRSAKAGKEMGLVLSLKTKTKALNVIETKLRQPKVGANSNGQA